MAAARRRGSTPTIPTAPPRNDAYTALLVVALLAMLTAAGFLLAEYWGDYNMENKPTRSAPAGVMPGGGST